MRAVIFDLDGTLVDSLDQIHESVNHARSSYGCNVISRGRVKELLGLPAENLFVDLATSDEEIHDLILKFRAHLTELILIENKVYPGVTEVLQSLKADDFLIGVATSKPGNLTELVIKNSNLKLYVDYFQGTDGFMPKPSPDVILKAIYGLGAMESIMVGDRMEDILAAKAAGILGVGVAQSGHSQEQLSGSGATLVFSSMLELSVSVEKITELFLLRK